MLPLDPNVIKNSHTYSSLEDISGYHIFSEEWDGFFLAGSARQELELNNAYAAVSTGQKSTNIETCYQVVMAAPQDNVIKKTYEEIDGFSVVYFVFAFVISVLATSIVLLGVQRFARRIKGRSTR